MDQRSPSSASLEVAWRASASGSSSQTHAAAVVGDPDQAAPALLQRHLDGARARVDGVLDQLLDHGRRPLDHLSGRDAVDHALGQETNRHGSASRSRRTIPLPRSTAG